MSVASYFYNFKLESSGNLKLNKEGTDFEYATTKKESVGASLTSLMTTRSGGLKSTPYYGILTSIGADFKIKDIENIKYQIIEKMYLITGVLGDLEIKTKNEKIFVGFSVYDNANLIKEEVQIG